MTSKHTNQPLVSVYIPTKNRPQLLKRAIDSVLAQTYPAVEIVISDDGSTDDTPDFVRSLQKQHSNIVYLREEQSKGACHARNKAIRAASGEFVTGLDDDDRFAPNRIASFVKAWQPEVSFLCSLNYIDDGVKLRPSHYYKKIIRFDDQVRRNYVGTQIFTHRQTLLDNGLQFDERYPAWQDYDFFTTLLLKLGPAKRVYNRSYIQHTDHEQNRITDPRRIRKGYSLFSAKFKPHMTSSQRISLLVNANILRGHRIGDRFIKMCWQAGNWWDLFRIYKKQRLKR
ncbi:glycosyl transferase family 2 [Neiella marina]|uniref:Glycosyl transferase family 2 n=1 Tax=Neiella marina TaxID=508461 RepID=A0A8J2U7P7_9GAMM|nr:glycosyltransferase [Neiella marina]GGA84280.1 glycosyl transferase family 2 [Neiella marina]